MAVTKKYREVDRFIRRKAKIVTRSNVGTTFSKTRLKDDALAHLQPWDAKDRRKMPVYEIVFSPRIANKKYTVETVKKVAAHELAHIKYQYGHNKNFHKVAKQLGSGDIEDSRIDHANKKIRTIKSKEKGVKW
jgi:predicted metal-dependent hydrolase